MLQVASNIAAALLGVFFVGFRCTEKEVQSIIQKVKRVGKIDIKK